MFGFKQKGDFNKIKKFLNSTPSEKLKSKLDSWGQRGVDALSLYTPRKTGLTANSWSYKTSASSSGFAIEWYNSNTVTGAPLAILLQYGHGTNNGGYVEGRDYINPAIQPIFDDIAIEAWAELIK